MPEFTVKEVRLPELHMPEIKREEIVRSLSGVRLPDVDLAKARDVRIKVPTLTLTSTDIGRLLAAGAAIVRFVRPTPRRAGPLGLVSRRSRLPAIRIAQPRRRRRWRLAAGLAVLAAIGAWVVMRQPAIRERADRAMRDARTQFDAMRERAGNPASTDSASPAADESPAATGEIAGIAPATDDAGPSSSSGAPAASSDETSVPSASPAFEESTVS